MEQNQVQLILFAEQMAALAATTIAELRALFQGSSTKTTDEILADADATYAKIIENAKVVPPSGK